MGWNLGRFEEDFGTRCFRSSQSMVVNLGLKRAVLLGKVVLRL